MREKDIQGLSRRDFFKRVGAAGIVTSGLSACVGENKTGSTWGEPTGEMTYRTHPQNGDHVSILCYGCMRFENKSKKNW